MCDFSRYGGRSDEWLEVEKSFPPPPPLASVEALLERQAPMNKAREEMAAKEMESLERVKIRDYTIPTHDGQTVEARCYWPTTADSDKRLPVYIHLHGGGFFFGTLASEDAICARIASNVGVIVLNVNYRHTSELPYPTAWTDTEDAFVWLHSNIDELGGDSQQVVVGGVSAGAQLTAALTLGKRLHTLGAPALACPPIAGQVLMIPCLVHMDCYEGHLSRMKDPSVSSYKENEHAPLLPATAVRLYLDLQKIENLDPKDFRMNPGNASSEQVTGLPPTTFGVAGLDPLRDEGLLYAKMLSEAGSVLP